MTETLANRSDRWRAGRGTSLAARPAARAVPAGLPLARAGLLWAGMALVGLGGPGGLSAAMGQAQSAPSQDQQDQQLAADAQEQADWDLVSAYERVIARAIARAEKSVVSIARNKAPPEEPLDPRGLRFRLRQAPKTTVDPRDPHFVPNQFGTGVVVDASGLVLTSYHVVDKDSDHYVTTIDRKVFRMIIKAADPRSDLAVLAVAPDETQPQEGDFVPITFGDAEALKKGETVIALGNPYAIARDGQVSASRGIVANLSRKVGFSGSAEDGDEVRTLHNSGGLIQTDARLNLGTSGGALINLRGEMVGLTTSLAATAGYEMAAGYAIPVDDTFLRVLQRLKNGQEVEYGLLGIVPFPLETGEVHRGLHGIRVSGVSSGTPARQYGLQERDIITHIDGRPIYEPDHLRLHVGKLPPRATTMLTVLRDGKPESVDVVLTKYPVRGEKIITQRPPAWRGLQVDFTTAVVENNAYEGFHNQSVAVSQVQPDSPAWKAGLRAAGSSFFGAMLISHVGAQPVDDPEDFRRIVAELKGPVRLSIVNHGEIRQVMVAP